MISLFFGMMLAVTLGPIAPDAPAHEPHLVANGSIVGVTFGAGGGLNFSSSIDSGKTFSLPVSVAEAAVVPLTRHRGPRIALSGNTIVISAVAGRTLAQGPHVHGLPADGDLIAWRSFDGGRSWSRGIVINDVLGAPTEGLHSLASDAKGTLFAAWLDKRGGKGTSLYGSRSTDGGLTWSKNVLIYASPEGTICECCHPSVAMESDGRTLVMWRNWLHGSRDMYLARSRDGLTFSTPEKLGTGTWQLNACPMDGGGVVVNQGKVVTAWRREHEVFLASPGEKEVGIAEGVDVAIAAGKGGVYAIWSTPTGLRALLPGKTDPVAVAPKGSFPNIVVLPTGRALASWENDGRIVIQPVP